MGTCRFVYNRALGDIKNKKGSIFFEQMRDKYVTRDGSHQCEPAEPASNQYIKTEKDEKLIPFTTEQRLIWKKNNNEPTLYDLFYNTSFFDNPVVLNEWEFETPKDVRAGAVDDLAKAYKTSISQLKTGLIGRFCINFKKKQNNQSIVIPKSAIGILPNGRMQLFPTFLKKTIKLSRDFKKNKKHMTLTEKQNRKKIKLLQVSQDCRLLQEDSGWFICIPIVKHVVDNKPKYEDCALDPGSRKFQVLYSPQETVFFVRDKLLLKKLRDRQAELQRFRSSGVLKKKVFIKKVRNVYSRYNNLLYDFHDKTIHYLVQNYSVIYLPIFESQEIVKIARNSTARYNLLSLSHFRFRKRLQDRAELCRNTTVNIVSEEFTTKTCTRCGCINDVGSNEIYNCSRCGLRVERDLSGARNIYIKNKVR
jgi:transposase